jgi:hypothetical protein
MFENWTPKPSESTSDSNFTDVTSRALSTSQYKFNSNLRDQMKKKSWPTTSNYIEVTRNLYCAPGAL